MYNFVCVDRCVYLCVCGRVCVFVDVNCLIQLSSTGELILTTERLNCHFELQEGLRQGPSCPHIDRVKEVQIG